MTKEKLQAILDTVEVASEKTAAAAAPASAGP